MGRNRRLSSMASEEKEEKKRDRREGEEGGGFFGKFLAFFLGILIGIIIPIAGVAGVAYIVWNKPAKETVNLIDGSGNLYNTIFDPVDGFINPDYADKLVGELLQDTASAVQAISNGGSMADIAKISPKVGKAVDALVEQTDFYGLGITRDEVLAKPVGELLPYLQDKIDHAPLGNLLQGNSGKEITDPMLLTICFGSPLHYKKVSSENNVTYEMLQITYVYKEDKMYDINGTLEKGQFNEETKVFTLENGTVYYLALDPERENTYLAFEDEARKIPVKYPYTTIANLTENPSGMVDGIYLCDAMGINKDSDPMLISLAYGVKGEHYEIQDGEIVMKEGCNPRTIGELKDHSEDIINDITLADAMGIDKDSHPILISLAYGTKEKDYNLNGDTFDMLGDSKPRTIGDLSTNSDELINGVHLTDIIAPKADSAITMYLLYGREDIHWAKDGDKVIPLEKKIAIAGVKAYNEWGEPLDGTVVDKSTYYEYTDTTGNVFHCLPMTNPEKKIKTTDGGEAKLCILANTENVSVGKYEPTTLGAFSEDDHLGSITNRMTLGEIVGKTTAEKNFLLKHVQDETISSLPTAITELTVNEVFSDKVYSNPGAAPADRILTGTWAYLLKDPTTGKEVECKLNEIETLVNNMTQNVQTASLTQLRADNMLTVTTEEGQPDPLSASIAKTDLFVAGSKETLGDLNINELFSLVSSLLSKS